MEIKKTWTLSEIQEKIKVSKDLENKFGNYKYRTAEGILNAFKALETGVSLLLQDEIVMIGSRYYVKAVATLGLEPIISVTAYAREAEDKKGMDVAQITGAASSYARKYALAGLFALDDGKDPDSVDNSEPKPTIIKQMADKKITF